MTDFTMPPMAPVAFDGLFVFAWISFFLLVGMLLRAVFPLFRKYLIPSCIIGGTVGLICQSTGLIDATGLKLDIGITQNFVYDVFNLTWIYVGLKMPTKQKSEVSEGRAILAYISASTSVSFFTLAAAMAITTILAMIGLNSAPQTVGSLTMYGFIMGPGQAFTIGTIWDAATTFAGMPDFGLATGAMGFAVAIIVGVFLVNIIARKKKLEIVTCPSEEEECGFYDECSDTAEAGRQTTSATSIDVLAWHIALGFATYALSFIICLILFIILPPALKIFVWTTFFLFGALIAVGVRILLTKMGKGHLLCVGVTNRISGTLVDFLVCSTFISIQIGQVAQYMIPYLASVIVSTMVIAGLLWYYSRKMKEYGPEYFAYVFGNLTGTVSTAFILLRLVDPENKSPVPLRMGLGSALSIPTVILIPAIAHMEPLYGSNAWIPIGISFAIGVAIFVLAKLVQVPQSKTAWEVEEK